MPGMANPIGMLAANIRASQAKAAELNLNTQVDDDDRDRNKSFYKKFSLGLYKWKYATWAYVELVRRVAHFYLAMQGVACEREDPGLWRLLGRFDFNPRKSVMEVDDARFRPLGVTMGTVHYTPETCEQIIASRPVNLRELHALLFNLLMVDEEVFWGGIRRIAEGDARAAEAARNTTFSFDYIQEVRARCATSRFQPKEPPFGWVYLHLWSHRLRSHDKMLSAFGSDWEEIPPAQKEELKNLCPIVKYVFRMDHAWRPTYDGWKVHDGVPALTPRELAYFYGDDLPVEEEAGSERPGKLWIVGRMSYTASDCVVPGVGKSFKQQLIGNGMEFVDHPAIGVSSTADLFMIAARYMGFTTDELYLLQMSLLATMLMVGDHTVFEVVASAHPHGLTFPLEADNVGDFFGNLIPTRVRFGAETTSNTEWRSFLDTVCSLRPRFYSSQRRSFPSAACTSGMAS